MIRIEGLKKQYGDFSLDVSMEVPAGRVTGIVGVNGAGKTTVIKAILGLIRYDGTVKVLGIESRKLSSEDKMRIGAVLSDASYNKALNVKDIAAVMGGLYDAFDSAEFIERCTSASLPVDKPVSEFSTGMRAKLKVLEALSHNADLLILDEPTAGLDVQARVDILDELRRYLSEKEDRSILISSHISSDLEGICDDIYFINGGRIMLHEETHRLTDNYCVLKVDDETYEKLDKSRILGAKRENFGYSCFTADRQFFEENYPGMVIQRGSIDDLILIMAGGERK